MRALAPALLLLAAGCGRAPDAAQDLDALDRELSRPDHPNTARDPALAAAVNGQIMIDPALAQSSNANAVRPAPRPDSGAVPPDLARPDPVDARTLRHAPAPVAGCPQCRTRAGAFTLGALAQAQPGAGPCARVTYSAGWANRLSPDLPLYPDARVVEAAGNAGGACRLRLVTFASSAAPGKVIDWYYTRATRAGYSAEQRRDASLTVLGGTRGEQGYVVYVAARPGGGSDVDLVSNAGE